MKTPAFASSKTRLAQALGIGRSLLYQYYREVDFPQPRANGMWHIPTVRRYIAKKGTSTKGSEKQELQNALLKTRLARETFELEQARGATERKILDKLMAEFHAVMLPVRTRLETLLLQLCPRCEGMSARESYQLWRAAVNELFNDMARELEQRTGGKSRIAMKGRNRMSFH